MDRFLLAMNDMSGNGDVAIIHTFPPQSIIEVKDGHVKSDSEYYYYGIHESELYTLIIRHYFTTEIHGTKEQNREQVDKLLKKAWHWYKSYLEWEDEKFK